MVQSMLVRFALCYLMIAVIVARPLPDNKEKRQSSSKQMEDVQLTVAGMQPNGEESPDDEEEVIFYSSGGINLWKDGVIPYSFQKDFDPEAKKKAKKAMEMWSERTCITFRRVKVSEMDSILDFVKIQYNNITNSFVGRKDRDYKTAGQELNVRESQSKVLRVYLHEFGHVIGLNHEHSRQDRDQYVRINSKNIVSGVGHNFDKLSYYVKDTPYDYYSIMHYGIYNYASNKSEPTIEILNPDNDDIDIDDIGARRKLSEDDIKWANKLYKCPSTTVVSPVKEAPKLYRQFKVELAHVPKTIPRNGYVKAKQYLKCNSTSCVVKSSEVKSSESVHLFIVKLGSSEGGLHIGDKVLLTSQRSGIRRGEWILCEEETGCHSSQACKNNSFNASSGEVNFAFNRSGCKDQVLNISSKTLKLNDIVNSTKIILEYSNPRTTQEWLDCDPGGVCKRTSCNDQSDDRTNITHLKHSTSTTCKDQMDEFEAIFVS